VKVKFLADASLSESIVSGVIRAESSIDFLDANSAGLESLSDDESWRSALARIGFWLLTT